MISTSALTPNGLSFVASACKCLSMAARLFLLSSKSCCAHTPQSCRPQPCVSTLATLMAGPSVQYNSANEGQRVHHLSETTLADPVRGSCGPVRLLCRRVNAAMKSCAAPPMLSIGANLCVQHRMFIREVVHAVQSRVVQILSLSLASDLED